jgi:Tfp pilus assembly protein PilN
MKTFEHDELIVGGEPRAVLLPPEVGLRRRAKQLRRTLGLSLMGVILLTAAGYSAATWGAMQSQAALADAQQRTALLVGEQAKYIEVHRVQDQVLTAEAALQIGASTEIDWKSYLEGVRAVLPSDVSIDTVTVDSASPLVPYGQPTAPLQAQRAATLTLTLTSPALPTVPDWLTAMKSLPGYADGAPTSITRSEEGAYKVSLVVHINEGAFANRFAAAVEGPKTDASAADPAEQNPAAVDSTTSSSEGN